MNNHHTAVTAEWVGDNIDSIYNIVSDLQDKSMSMSREHRALFSEIIEYELFQEALITCLYKNFTYTTGLPSESLYDIIDIEFVKTIKKQLQENKERNNEDASIG